MFFTGLQGKKAFRTAAKWGAIIRLCHFFFSGETKITV
jgi:hypothetical protein